MSTFPAARRARSLALTAAALLALFSAVAPATAEPLVPGDQQTVLIRADQSAEDTLFSLEQAIIGAGLAIDYHSHIGDMLERTRADVGSDKVLFTKADILVFCSAALSRRMMEADITAIAQCPYSIFVFERPEEPGASYVGFRRVSGPDDAADSPRGEIDALLKELAEEAAGG